MKLEDIQSPEFVKDLTITELELLAKDIRTFILHNVSKTGGHLSSNLGSVELIIALHYVFNSPIDKLVFDVGHQVYTHKILTGRAKDFDKLRKKDGLAAFLKYTESEHDVWEAGHSSTSISALAGFLEAKASGVNIGEVIAIIGDGAIQNGLAFEGLNYLGNNKQKGIVIINDNDMSISKNVGRLSRSLSKIRIRKSYEWMKKITPTFVQRLFRSAKNAVRGVVYGSNVFANLGYKYYGPIDGHNIRELIKYFQFAKRTRTSVILHVKTVKGKGYQFAEGDINGKWHGVSPFDIVTGKSINTSSPNNVNWGKGICELLVDFVSQNNKIYVITPAMISGSSLQLLQEKFPKNLIDVGINEEHAVVMAAAMSRNGLIPIVSIYSTFLQRSYDEVSHDVARNNNHVIFLIDRAGINGGDGSTHQGIFDVAFLSHLPNMVITTPKDLSEAKNLLKMAIEYDGPFVIRYPKKNVVRKEYLLEDIQLGSWVEELPIQDLNIITYGDEVDIYKDKLKNVGLINARFIKPIDINMLKKLANKQVIIVEEVVRNGSLGSLINDANIKSDLNLKIKHYAIDDIYLDTGTIEELKVELGIDVDSIISNL